MRERKGEKRQNELDTILKPARARQCEDDEDGEQKKQGVVASYVCIYTSQGVDICVRVASPYALKVSRRHYRSPIKSE